ncbi:MAG: hypothetical protein KJO41_07595 [Bacteroidia bacterium]|nr:hypothetical protein [Bacteroidia bacterium]MBT8278850.1 hypothetical protein [Bacteroidia bacterium]NND25916.1 hypothetical protein [Flavobacteriaceae bacterium]NNK60755.1 hypothetical protein [Flavobacteriaceae bacterium]NNL33554.1 hypothetical protein [Flavobacteriaceae bacterium]
MLIITQFKNLITVPLIEQISIVTILIVTVAFFFVLLILGILQSKKLRAENERLSKPKGMSIHEQNKVYRDFREGHLYDNY